MSFAGTLNLTTLLTGITAALPVGGAALPMAEALSLSLVEVFRYPSPCLHVLDPPHCSLVYEDEINLPPRSASFMSCLLYTSDAADE